jgi:hypothetical protein
MSLDRKRLYGLGHKEVNQISYLGLIWISSFFKRTGGRALLIILSLNKRFYVQAKKRKMKKNYGRLLSHDCISEARLCFALWIANEKYFLKLNLHLMDPHY